MMVIRPARFEDEEGISGLIAQFRVELKQLKGIQSAINIEQAREEFTEYMNSNMPVYVAWVHPNNDKIVPFLRAA